jgi:bacillithiol biosynthesis deacetylase BshB1
MKADILAFAAHPDDIELAASGTILKHVAKGKKVVIIDLTRGELGTRGSAEIRDAEAAKSAEILGLSARHNLDLGDGFFEITETTLIAVVKMIRMYQPKVVICNAESDRHPDHGRGGDLVSRACFLAGLSKVETFISGEKQEKHRPLNVFRYIKDRYIKPDIVIDVTDFMDKKMESIYAFSSQFYNPESKEPETPISSKAFIDYVQGRSAQFGRIINVKYGEGFTVERAPGIEDLTEII